MVLPTGKAPAETDVRTLRLSNYVELLDRADEAPPVRAGLSPAGGGLYVNGQLKSIELEWNPLGNDVYKDCVPAAMLNLSYAWRSRQYRADAPTRDQALEIYKAISGFQPETPADAEQQADTADRSVSERIKTTRDYGASVLSGLKFWARDDAEAHRLVPIRAFMECEAGNLDQIRDAIDLFGGVIVGLLLPDSARKEDDIGVGHWALPPYGPVADGTPGSWESHCVPLLGYNPRRVAFVTWGSLRTMSWQFLLAYCDEAYAVVPSQPEPTFEGAAQLNERLDRDKTSAMGRDRQEWVPALTRRWWPGGNIM